MTDPASASTMVMDPEERTAQLLAAVDRLTRHATADGRPMPTLTAAAPGVDPLARFRSLPPGGQAGRH